MRKKIHSIILALVLTISFCLGIGVNVNAAPVNQTVEGEGNHYVTGNAYPSTIEVVGYDVAANKYYVNFKLSREIGGTTVNLKYYVQLFDDTKTLVAKDGEPGSEKVIAMTSSETVTSNILSELQLPVDGSSLTAQYNLLITVSDIAAP